MSSIEETSWLANTQLCGRKTRFKLDTRVEVMAISNHTFHGLGEEKLISPKKVLHGPSRRPLQVTGHFEGKFVHGSNTIIRTVYVVSELETNLLGLPGITPPQPCHKSGCHHENPIYHPDVPIRVQWTRKFRRGGVHNQNQARSEALCPVHPTEHSVTVMTQSETRTGQDGVNWGNLQNG